MTPAVRPPVALAWVVVLAALVGAGGCGELPELPPVDAGRVCYVDGDCVPDGCCGQALSVIHAADAPDCSLAQCSSVCPLSEVRCGCGLPVCRNNRCQVAVSTAPGC